MKNQIKTTAIILHSIRWKESSKIVTMYTEAFGITKLIARGAYRKGSSLAGKIETLMLVDAVLNVKESRSINIIKEIDIVDTFSEIRTNMKLLPYALSLIEIINQVLEETDSDSIFFNFIVEMINAVRDSKTPEIVLVFFLLKLSSYLGFKPELGKCGLGDTNLCSEKIYLSMNNGKVSCKNCDTNTSHPLIINKDQYLFLKDLQKVSYRLIRNYEKSRSDSIILVEKLLRYLNFHLDKEIRVSALQLILAKN